MVHGARWSRRELFAGSAAATLGLVSTRTLAFAQGQRTPGPGVERSPELDQIQPAGTPDEAYWRKIRSQFSLRDDLAFLNTGTCGPVPRPVLDVQDHYSRELARDPSNNFRGAELSSVRKRLAGFVNASPDEIALTHSTTEGLNLFAHGLDWKPGDEVLLGTQEHFSAHEAYLWVEKRYGARIVWAEIPAAPESVEQVVALYAKAITPRTKVVVLSEVAYTSGLRLPLKELSDLAHDRRRAGFGGWRAVLRSGSARCQGDRRGPLCRTGSEMAAGRHGHRSFRTFARTCRSRSGRSRVMSMPKDRAARARLPAIVTNAAGR